MFYFENMDLLGNFKKNNSLNYHDNIYWLEETAEYENFMNLYHELRKIEGRIYNDEIVEKLPDISPGHKYFTEWKIRKNSSGKLINYLSGSKKEYTILELGCGNGWLSNHLSDLAGAQVIGIDLNSYELRQATKVFRKKNLFFCFADIFKSDFGDTHFDIIVIASTLMYFPDLKRLLKRLLDLLKPTGEIHLIDNPLYKQDEISNAAERSEKYYFSLGFPEMSAYYYHHPFSDLYEFHPLILYNPDKLLHIFKGKILRLAQSPFYWIKILNDVDINK